MLKVETIAKNFKIFWSLQVRTCVYVYRALHACNLKHRLFGDWEANNSTTKIATDCFVLLQLTLTMQKEQRPPNTEFQPASPPTPIPTTPSPSLTPSLFWSHHFSLGGGGVVTWILHIPELIAMRTKTSKAMWKSRLKFITTAIVQHKTYCAM